MRAQTNAGLALALTVALTSSLVAAPSSARPDQPGSDLFTFDAGDDVLVYDTDGFRFHYTVAGTHSIPVADTDDSGVPDHVEALGVIYEDALAFYAAAGFRAPVSDVDFASDNGGDGRFDVYLVDFDRNADGAYRSEVCDGDVCAGYMVQENDFRGYSYPSVRVGNLTVGSHELFHAVQAAYNANQGSVLSEGTAVWASEQFEPSLFDLEGFSFGYMNDAAVPLDTVSGTPVDPFSYGSAIFFQHLSERHGDDVIRAIWQSTVDDDWFAVIDDTLQEAAGVSFHDAFTDFSLATVFTGDRHDVDFGFEGGDDYAERDPEDEAFPLSKDRYVTFTTSSRLMHASPGARPQIELALGRADQLDGVTAFLIAIDDITGDKRVDSVEGDADRAVVDVSDNDDVFVLMVNARQQGQGARPLVCAGDAAEVDACLAALDDVGEGEGEEGEGEGEDVDDPDLSGGGCHCASPAEGSSSSPASSSSSLLALAGLLALGARRRQRRA